MTAMLASPKQSPTGFTLPELLVAMVVGMLLMGFVLQMLIMTNESYQTQKELSWMQENGRFATAFFRQAVSNADYWGCVGRMEKVADSRTGTNWTTPAISGSPNQVELLSGTDGTVTTLSESASPGDGELTLANPGAFDDDPVLIADCQQGDLVTLADDNANPVDIDDGTLSHPRGAYPAGTPVTRAQRIEFRIDPANQSCSSGDFAVPALQQRRNGGNWEPLLCGVDEMALRYGVDTDGDTTPNQYITAGNVTDWGNVYAVRAAFVVRSRMPVPDAAGSYSVLGNPKEAEGDFAYKVFTTTAPLRNRMY